MTTSGLTIPSIRAQVLTRRTYNRPLNDEGTKFETWHQTIDRVIGHQRWLWEMAQGDSLTQIQTVELEELRQLYLSRKGLPAGRTLWLGGTEIVKRRSASNFNCSFLDIRTVHDFVDAFWLLLQGCGVGFRPVSGAISGFTRRMDVEIIRSTRTEAGGRKENTETYDPDDRVWTIQIGDSAEAWAKTVGKVVAGKFPARKIVFDLSQIRPAGTRLKGYGWLCSGDGPLSTALEAISRIMSKRAGKLLTRMDIWDIVNWLGTVLSSRRSAQIGLIDFGDPEWKDVASRKPPGFDAPGSPNWFRGQSNNSIVFHERPTARQIRDLFDLMISNGGSEPGFINAAEAERRAPWFKGLNPCGEIILANYGFCVSGDTLMITRDGVSRIDCLIGTDTEVWNGEKWSKVTPQITGTNQELVRVSFGDGSFLDCTPYHRFSVKDRFGKEYSEVQARDLMRFSRFIIHTEPTTIEYDDGIEIEDAYTIGAMVGDGDTSCGGISLDLYGAKIDLPVVGRKGQEITKPGYNVASVAVSELTGLDRKMIRRLKDYASELDQVFTWTRRSILEFLAGWLDTDGSNTSGGGIRLYLSRQDRALRVQLLLTKCGIRSSVNLHQAAGTVTNYGPRKLDSYYVQITDCGEIPCHRLDVSLGHVPTKKGKHQTVRSVVSLPGRHTVYCFNEPERHKAVFGNVLTYQCNLVDNNVAAFRDDHRGLHRAIYLNARANYRQTVVNLRDGILQDAWHQTNEYLRLCGVGLMGMARRPDMSPYDYKQLRNTAVTGAYSMAHELGLEEPKNVTTVKPGGTLPKIADTTEGIGRPLGNHIFNNVQFSRNDPIVPRLLDAGYRVSDHPNDPTGVLITLPMAFIDVPVLSGPESAVAQLDRYKMSQSAWCDQNTSITVSYDPSEVPSMVKWFDRNWDSYVGVSFLFRNDATKSAKDLGFSYLPQEIVTRDSYESYVAGLKPIDMDDSGDSSAYDSTLEDGCSTGACPVR